jgi:hypothetical protein
MHLLEFKEKLKTALGKNLEHATPANVREFVDQIQLELWLEDHPKPAAGQRTERIEIESSEPMTYEGLMRSFFMRALDGDRDQSLIQLWILSLDLAYSGIEEMHSERMQKLFTGEGI